MGKASTKKRPTQRAATVLYINAEDNKLYEHVKRELAKQTWKYMQNYADAKSAVVAEIMARAQNTDK